MGFRHFLISILLAFCLANTSLCTNYTVYSDGNTGNFTFNYLKYN